MRGKPTYRVPHRRRREGKTDYRLRLRLLKSGKLRFVVRRSLRHIQVQVIEYRPDGDRTILAVHSCRLKKLGWKAPCGNLPAAYLTGLLAGKLAKEKGIQEGILDMGLYPSVKGSRIYASLKGLVDAGIRIPHSPEILPDEKRIKGEHIAEWAKKLEKERYQRFFSEYLKAGLKPENLPKHFEEIKKKIG